MCPWWKRISGRLIRICAFRLNPGFAPFLRIGHSERWLKEHLKGIRHHFLIDYTGLGWRIGDFDLTNDLTSQLMELNG